MAPANPGRTTVDVPARGSIASDQSYGATHYGFTQPVTIPSAGRHTHSFIVLHGRGDNGHTFGHLFSNAETSQPKPPGARRSYNPDVNARRADNKTLQDVFPGLKLVFPTAKKSRAAAFNGTLLNQWFDQYSIRDIEARKGLQYEGLRDSARYIHQLLDEEVRLVGPGNVIIGGLSMGCAASFHALLSYQARCDPETGHPTRSLGGYVGMSGWLPLEKDIDAAMRPSTEDLNDNVFGGGDAAADAAHPDGSLGAKQVRAANFVRGIQSLSSIDAVDSVRPSFVKCPIFIGHGTLDEKVPLELGEQAVKLLRGLGVNVTWKTYEFGHWWAEPEEIDDIATFLQETVGMPTSE